MPSTYLLALDAGGGGGHAVVVDVQTARVTRAFRPWRPAVAPGTGGLGFDLDLPMVWRLLADAAREAVERAGARPEDVAGVAATSMRHTTIVLDAAGDPLFAATNRDGRAFLEAFELMEDDPESLQARIGHWPTPITTAPRLAWLAKTHPDAWGRAAAVVSLNDWIAMRMCGEIASDASQASETLLFDVVSGTWAADVAERRGVPPSVLPAIADAGTRLGALTADAAADLGLRPGTAVAVGGGDTQCGLLGTGAVDAGETAIIAGTTVPVQMVLDEPCVDLSGRLWAARHVVPGRWVLESNAGGMGEMLDWLAHVMCGDLPGSVGRFLAEASLTEPGTAGIFSSLGGSIMNARALELPMGTLTLTHMATASDPHRRAHVARAHIDGMAHTIRGNLRQLIDTAGREPSTLHFAGGIAESRVVAQTIADVVARPVRLATTRDATAVGAAIAAGVGAGVFGDLAEGARCLAGDGEVLAPDAARAEQYQSMHEGWLRLREARTDADTVARELALPAVLASYERQEPKRAATITRPRILVTAQMDDDGLAALRELGDVEYASFRDSMRLLAGDTLVDALAGVDVFITEVDIVDAAALDRLPDLRVVVACRADAVNVDAAACAAFGIPVLNAPGRNADAVADLTVAFMLMLARRLPVANAFLREPGIEPGDMGRMGQAFGELRGNELWRKTVGLIGFGAVGSLVARRLAGFGARVMACDPYASPERLAIGGAQAATLDDVLTRSDFVSLHAAVTDQTRGMIGTDALAGMKPGACLVNTARAALVDEDALTAALQSGHLAGAALDVFAVEPPGSDHPLLALEQVIATPHVGGNTVEVGAHQAEIVTADLARLLAGEPPLHAVEPGVLDGFDWTAPRPVPDRAALAALADRPGPAVSDLERDRGDSIVDQSSPDVPTAPADVVEKMRRLLESFCAGVSHDDGLATFAADKSVVLRFTLPDVGLHFHVGLQNGTVASALGDPDGDVDVELRMRAEVFDGIFSGSVNAMEAATSGRLGFTGDTMKAMTLQEIQDDLTRLYVAAREDVGSPGDLSAIPEPGGARPPAPRAIAAGDPREEVVHVIDELYAAGLITATGGNVSIRVPGTDEIWITPGQVFKGELTPQMMVRVDLDGHPLETGAPSPSSELLMHCAIYRARPEANAVIHAHAPNATVLADAELPFLPVSTEAAFFGELPRVPFIMPGTQDLADAVADAATKSWGVLMQNHGILVAGRSLRRAADMAEVIERSCEVILGCYAVGKTPTVLPDDIVTKLRKMGDMLA